MKAERFDICIIGCGASGLAAAITAARAGRGVVVLERDFEYGRSIKRTGDGRCNIANAGTDARAYHNDSFVEQAFRVCNPQQAIAFIESCGLVLREEAEGRLYPQANKATSVVDALMLAASRVGVRIQMGCEATGVAQRDEGWEVSYAQAHLPAKAKRITARDVAQARGQAKRLQLQARSVVYCVGGEAPASLFPPQVKLNRSVPVLGPLATNAGPLKGLDKVRVKCALSSGDMREVGEVTFRTYGVSGIAAFNLSRHVKQGDTLAIDFLPSWEADATMAKLVERFDAMEPCMAGEYFTGMLLPEVAHAILREVGLREGDSLAREDLSAIAHLLRSFPLVVKGIGDEKLCQVHRGGIDVEGVNPETMELIDLPGLYACGEALDVDAPCGGYNLHWAWASGVIAGEAASAR